MRNFKYSALLAAGLLFMGTLMSCEDTKSYSDLLNEEEHAANWFLSGQRVCVEIPADSVFETGENAPFYKMNPEGSVYMKVIERGNMNDRPKEGQKVYFRFMRKDIKAMYEGGDPAWDGNAGSSLTSSWGTTSLIYGNTRLESTTKFGEGIQVPLGYLGYDCRVNLVIKSTQGFTDNQTTCIPYLYDVRYFKAEY